MERVSIHLLTFLFFLLVTPGVSRAAYFQTLPKNVRLVAVKEVFAMGIDSYYGTDMKSGPYLIKAQIDSKVLENVEGLGEYYFDKLKQYIPEAYEKFNAGSWEVKATSDAKVFGMGAAIGITDRLTAYASVPYYNVKINLEATRTSNNNYAEVDSIIRQNQQRLHGTGIVIDTQSLPDTNSELLQSVLVNYYGYSPAGTWEGKGYGDVELALKYRLTDWQDSGLAITSGAIVPTGRVESEDILQDISFGNGFWSAFLEFGGTLWFNPIFSVDSYLRGTWQQSVNRELRIPENYDYRLSPDRGNFNYHPGHKLNYSLLLGIQVNDWIKISPEYLYNFKQQSSFESPYENANNILAHKSQEESHSAKISFETSSIQSFLNKSFLFPFSAVFAVEKTLYGKNVPELTLASLEFRIMF